MPHPPILIGGGSDSILRTMARYADAANPMIDLKEAHRKIAAYCEEIGRDSSEIRCTIETQLFLNDDPKMQRRAVQWANEQYNTTEEELRKQLFGSVEDVKSGVQRLADEGAQEVMVFQLPRLHSKSALRFSEEVIPAFRQI